MRVVINHRLPNAGSRMGRAGDKRLGRRARVERAKTAEAGYEADKKINGHKRHVLADTGEPGTQATGPSGELR